MSMTSQHDKEATTGVLYALACYSFWGFSPIYFKLVNHVPSMEVLGHRIVWSVLMLAGLLWLRRRWGEFARVVRDFQEMRWLLVSAVLISFNWGTYIYTVQSGQILEASLGYYINPLVSVLLGVLFLGETMRRWQMVSLTLATVATLYLALDFGQVPWLALMLAFSFGFYGLVRKMAPAAPLVGLFVETLMVAPLALLYLAWLDIDGVGHFGAEGWYTNLMLVAAGLVTMLPLLWFTNAAKRLRLATIGFFQYLAPSLQLVLAVIFYDEVFTPTHAITFAMIWTALAIYSTDAWRAHRRLRRLRDA
ncbi:MAG: EamA family transporter RarD [Gammaproteobacteria bacterium]|nr:EamA family transporter RarD [Gammaproteobacteria bacterium]